MQITFIQMVRDESICDKMDVYEGMQISLFCIVFAPFIDLMNLESILGVLT